MIPNATQQRAEALLKMYAEAEEELITIIASRVGMVGHDPPQWAQQKLKQVQEVRAELRTAIDGLAKQSLEERIKLMWAAHDEGADGLLRELGIEGAISTARSQAAVTLIDDYNERFSELHRRILRDATDVYRDVLNQALPMAAMGVETTQQAIRRALNAFADRGITAFVDKAGRRWGMAEYAEMATRTGMMNAALAGYTQEALNHNEDLVIITDHADECPLCASWERRVLSLTGAQLSHPDCSGTIADARAAGLFHPNCLHGMTVYVPGLTIVDGGKPSGSYYGSDDQRGYQQRQLQRYYERTVRRWKRRQAAATTPEDERIAKAYVDKWQRKLRELIGDNPKLPRKYSREGGRVLLSEAAKKMKALQVSENGGIINNSKDLAWLKSGYDRAVDKGDISALTGFTHYRKVAQQIERELIGLTTQDGIVIDGYVTHFVDRIIGGYERKREPVSISDIKDALLNAKHVDYRRPSSGQPSNVYQSEKCWVSLNPNNHKLIQVTPKVKE